MDKIIITGATGFIGKALTEKLLNEGKVVYAVIRNKDKIKDLIKYKNLILIEVSNDGIGTLSKVIKDENIDVFYHLAKIGNYGKDMDNYSVQLDNLKLSCDAINEAIKMQCKKFVLFGSISQYQKNSNSYSLDKRLCSIYGAAKHSAQILCETMAHVNEIDINTVILPNCFGVGDHSSRSTNSIIKTFLSGGTPNLISGDRKYDLVYITDVVEGLKVIGQDGLSFKTYYIGNRNMRTFREIIEEMRDVINPKINLKFGTYNDSSFVNYSLIDIDALYNDTGFMCKADFKDNINSTVEWVKTLSE